MALTWKVRCCVISDRLSRLTLAVALLYVWLISVGTRTIRDGLRHLVDRNDRRDLSIFQIGLRFIERSLTNDSFFPNSAVFLPMTANCQVARKLLSLEIILVKEWNVKKRKPGRRSQ